MTAPRTLADALELRAERPDALPVAGGTDLMVAVNDGRLRPTELLDLSHVPELRAWRRENGSVTVGAGVTFARVVRELAAFPPLAQAARAVASPPIRNRATIGGNLATASPAGDAIPVLAAYDAELVVASTRGERRVRWNEFLRGPKATALGPDELIVRVEWRALDAPGAFAKVGTRNAMVIAIASVCLQLDPAARTVRLALGSVAPTVVRACEAERFAAAVVPWDDPERAFPEPAAVEFGRLAASATEPIDDVRGSAVYRRHAVEVLARRALLWTLDERRSAEC